MKLSCRCILRWVSLSLGLWLALSLGACSTPPTDREAGQSPDQMYAEAKDNVASGVYDKAIILYDKIEGRAAGTPLAQQVQIDKAYAHYKAGEPVLAVAAIDRFLKLHPASPVLDYALYLKGIVNFNDELGLFSNITRQDLAERDQKAAKDSFEAFKELVTRFPQSRYADDASHRMKYIVSLLAKSEIHVARYYYERSAYLAAINRAQTALTDYEGVPVLEDALFVMIKSYDALGLAQLRDDTWRVLQKNYPQTRYTPDTTLSPSDPWWKVW